MKGRNLRTDVGHADPSRFHFDLPGHLPAIAHVRQTYFTFEDTLTQIGLGYVFLFLFGFTRVRTQVIAFMLILICFWAAFALYPAPGPHFDYPARRRSAELGSQLHRLSLALEQKFQSLMGIR